MSQSLVVVVVLIIQSLAVPSIANKQLFKHRSTSSSTEKLLNNLPISRFSGTNKKLFNNLSKSSISTNKGVVKKSTKL